MSIVKQERTLDFVKIIGPGVDALERRKEHNDNEQVTAVKLRENIDRVKKRIFEGMKMLSSGASDRIKK